MAAGWVSYGCAEDQVQAYWATLEARNEKNTREHEERQRQRVANRNVGILDASSRDDTETVRAYINSGADVNVMPLDGSGTPLHDAVNNENLEMARILIEAGADVNLPTANQFQTTPLLSAAGYGNVEMIRLLVEAGALIDYSSDATGSVLETAAFWHHTDAVAELIRLGADVSGEAGNDALADAIHYDDLEMERMLIDAGATGEGWSVWLAKEGRKLRSGNQ